MLPMKSYSDISAIILAAGFSSRMGRFKPLLPLGDKTVLAHVIGLFKDAGIGDICVVAGHRAAEVLPVIEAQGARTVVNPDYAAGMFTSIKAGIRTLERGRGAFFILPVDIPLVRPRTVRDMLSARARESKIYYPSFSDRRGHPPLIPRSLAEEILAWESDGGLRACLARYEQRAEAVPVADEHILFDMDTPEDYQRTLDALGTYDIPTVGECMAMMTQRFPVDTRVFDHCLAVARVAVHLARILNSAGCEIDPDLVRASGMLHDLLRSRPDHARAAAQMLREMGYPKVADVVACHMNIRIKEEAPVQAGEIVYLADKLVQGNRLVSLHQRFGGSLMKFADNPKAMAAVKTRFRNAVRIKDRFETRTGVPLDLALSDLPPAAVARHAP